MRYRQKVRHRTLTPVLLVRVQLPQLKNIFGGKSGTFLEKFLKGNLGVIVDKKHYKAFLDMLPRYIQWKKEDFKDESILHFDEIIFFCEYRKEKPFLVFIPYNVIWCLPEAKKDLITFDRIIRCNKDIFLKEKSFNKSIIGFLK